MSGVTADNVGRSSGLIKAAGGGGKVGQIVQTVKTDTTSSTATSFTDITGITVNITPSASSSKILVMAHLPFNGGAAGYSITFRLVRDSTAIFAADSASNRPLGFFGSHFNSSHGRFAWQAGPINYLDSPSTTSETTYKIQSLNENVGVTYYNRTYTDNDGTQYDGRAAASISAIEILA